LKLKKKEICEAGCATFFSLEKKAGFLKFKKKEFQATWFFAFLYFSPEVFLKKNFSRSLVDQIGTSCFFTFFLNFKQP
jgi:hypothetical protein